MTRIHHRFFITAHVLFVYMTLPGFQDQSRRLLYGTFGRIFDHRVKPTKEHNNVGNALSLENRGLVAQLKEDWVSHGAYY